MTELGVLAIAGCHSRKSLCVLTLVLSSLVHEWNDQIVTHLAQLGLP